MGGVGEDEGGRMSFVTDVVVHVDYASREAEDLLGAPFPKEVTPLETENGGVGLRQLDALGVGGYKGFEGDIYAGAFNYLDVDAMVDWFIGLPWGETGSAVLSSSTEGDAYRVVVVRDGKVRAREAD